MSADAAILTYIACWGLTALILAYTSVREFPNDVGYGIAQSALAFFLGMAWPIVWLGLGTYCLARLLVAATPGGRRS